MQKRNQSRTERLVTIAFLIALEIVLTRFVSITTPVMRISFGVVPVALCAMLYGPWAAGIAYAIGDAIGIHLMPTGPFFPGFTLSALLTGILYGLFLYKKEPKLRRVALAAVVIMLVVNLGLNTYWATFLVGKSFLAILPVRIVKELLLLPITVTLILAVSKAFEKLVCSGHSA